MVELARKFFCGLIAALLAVPSPVHALRSNNIIFIRPSIDGGRYFVTEQSQGLYQWGYHLGFNAEYTFEPAEVATAGGGGRVSGVVDDLGVGFFTTGLGLTDWLNVGLDFPVAFYETFFNFLRAPNQCTVTGPCPKETKVKMGDFLFALKGRIIDSDRHVIGVSLQPFVTIPTGSGHYVTGFGQATGGAKLIIDTHIKRKLFLALNAGWQTLKETRWSADTANATVDDLLLLSGAANLALGKNLELVGEVFGQTLIQNPWAHQIQSPFGWLAGMRYSPGFIKRWAFGLSGGTGIGRGFGSPKFHALAQVRYKKTKVVELEGAEEAPVEVEAPYEEKIIITQTVHFEFDRWNIRPVSFPILDDVVTVLQQNQQIRQLRIEGHTDWIGSDEYNNRLSMKRANSVRDYLTAKGISADRLTAEGLGESRPIADNNTDLGRAKNRRTEFTVVETGP